MKIGLSLSQLFGFQLNGALLKTQDPRWRPNDPSGATRVGRPDDPNEATRVELPRRWQTVPEDLPAAPSERGWARPRAWETVACTAPQAAAGANIGPVC